MNSGFLPAHLFRTQRLAIAALYGCMGGFVGSAVIPMAVLAQDTELTLPTLAAPAPPTVAAPAPPPEAAPTVETPALSEAPLPELSEVFIDRTDYSLGATERQVTATPEDAIAAGVSIGKPAAAVVDAVAMPPESQSSWANTPVSYSMAAPEQGSLSTVVPTSISQGALEYFSRKLLRPLGQLTQQNVKLIFPLAVPAPITSLFGWRTHPISGTQRLHTGTDVGAAMGTPVLAALSGRVILADMMGGYGLAIALEHNNGIQQTLYAHLSEIFVKPGDTIQQGAVIGRVGSTGASTGPHLHFEFRQMSKDGNWVAMDAGEQLEISLGNLTRGLQVAQKNSGAIAQTPLILLPKQH